MSAAIPPDQTSVAVRNPLSALVHRQLIQLLVLIGIVIAAFFGTRALAANNRSMTLRDAAEWYRRGQDELAAGRVPLAIEAFRRASIRDRSQKRYTLTLAQALALSGDAEAARTALVALRDAAPEDRDVNLALARLAASAHDVSAAARYYHTALSAEWPPDAGASRRDVRIELIALLIAAHDTARAQSELFVLSSELPDDPAHHVEAARLFTETGDRAHALEHYQRALHLDPDNADALAGAGDAAFELGDYRLAHSYLRRLPQARPDVQHTRALVDVLLASDPWAARIGSTERRRRLLADFNDVQGQLVACAAERAGSAAPIDPAVLEEAHRFGTELQSRRAVDQETVEAAFDLIGRIEHTVLGACGPPTIVDQALTLLARQHGVESK